MDGRGMSDRSYEDSIFLDDGEVDDSFEMVCLNGHVATPVPFDKPECIDLSELSKVRTTKGGVIIIDSEDDDDEDDGDIIDMGDDDVVYVGSYIREDAVVEPRPEKNVRRNPVRSARNKSRSHSDLLYGDDLMLLSGSEETSDKENEFPQSIPGPSRRPQELPKEWPVNVHERPEYDDRTKQLHPLDRMMREAQAMPRPTARKQRPRLARKRRGRRQRGCGSEERLRPASCLAPQVESTLVELKRFVEATSGHESSTLTADVMLELLRDTLTMLMYVKDCSQEELIGAFRAMGGDEQD